MTPMVFLVISRGDILTTIVKKSFSSPDREGVPIVDFQLPFKAGGLHNLI